MIAKKIGLLLYILSIAFVMDQRVHAQGYLNPPVYATGAIYVQPGTNVSTTVRQAVNPNNINVYASGPITNWTVNFPFPAYDGQLIGVGCPGGNVTNITYAATSPDTTGPGWPTSCTVGFFTQYQYSANTFTWTLVTTNGPSLGTPVNVVDYGAAGNGVTDDKAAFDRAMASLGATGGYVNLSCSGKYYISTLVVPAGVSIRGCYSNPDNIGGVNQSTPYDTMGGIRLSSTSVSTTATTTYNSTTVTVTSTTGVLAGMSAESIGIPGGAVVTSVTDATHVVVDGAATGTSGATVNCAALTTVNTSTYATCAAGPSGILVGAVITAAGVPGATTVVGIDQSNNIIMSAAATASATVAGAFANPASSSVVFQSTITLKADAGVENMLIYRNGMTFPAANAAAYAGQALRCGWQSDGCFVNNVLVLGFEFAFISGGVTRYAFSNSRVRVKNFNYDTQSGIKISGAGDTNVFRDIKAWPWATVGNGGAISTQNRTGTGFLMQGQLDDTELDGISINGHIINYDFLGTASLVIGRLWSDYNDTGAPSGSIGIKMGLNTTRMTIGHAFVYSSDLGIQRAANATETATIGIVDCVSIRYQCVDVSGGDLQIGQLNAEIAATALTVSSTSSYVAVNSAIVRNMTSTNNIVLSVANIDTGHISIGTWKTDLAAGLPIFVINTLIHCTVAAAATINLAPNCSDFDLTGFAGINFATMNGGWGGRTVRTYFDGIGTVKNGTGNFRLAGAADVATTNGGFMSFTFDAALNKWRENYHGQ